MVSFFHLHFHLLHYHLMKGMEASYRLEMHLAGEVIALELLVLLKMVEGID